MKLAKQQLMKLLNISESKISTPPNPSMGDYSTTIAFDIAKEKGENPTISAITLISKLDLSKTLFSTVKAYGPYINFFLDKDKVISNVLKEVLKDKEKYCSVKKSKKVFLIEFPSPNTNKPLHIGHLLQMSLGQSLARVYENQGYNTKRINLYNDRGVHICKSMLAYEKWGRNRKPKKNEKSDKFVGDYYVMFANKKNAKLEAEVQDMLKAWEAGDKKVRALWKRMNDWCYKGHNETYKRVGLDKYDKTYYESRIYKQGKDIVLEGLKKGVFKKEEDGAVYADLDKLGKKYLMRKEGTALYMTQDLALAKIKYKDFKFDKCVYMTGDEQNHYFNQLFKVFELLDYKFDDKCVHLGTGMIRLPTGKMKSREGTTADADDLINEMSELTKAEMKKRKTKPSNKIAEAIALAAIKYYLLKVSSNKTTVFNPEESISFEGNTGPYLLYSLVRANKILKKNKMKLINSIKPELLNSDAEFELIKSMSSFCEAITKTMESFSPHVLCSFAYELASKFNNFYEKCPVLAAEENNVKKARLLLVKAFTLIMTKALYLLGITPVKEM